MKYEFYCGDDITTPRKNRYKRFIFLFVPFPNDGLRITMRIFYENI